LEITLMDISQEMLKMSVEKMEPGGNLKFKTLFFNLEMDDYKGDTFDIIYSQMVMHHIRDYNAIFREFYNLLTTGGILAIADLYNEDGSFHDGNMNVHNGFKPGKLISNLRLIGFSFYRCFTLLCYPEGDLR